MPDRLILGTVQLGLPYGIANATGKPNQEEANAIVRTAWEGGVRTFDTAQGYGDSESVLGAALAALGAAGTACVITKLAPALPDAEAEIVAALHASRARLGVPRFHCVMLHREEQLPLLDGYVGSALAAARDAGLLEHIGISVYSPERALAALRHPLTDVVQVPTSLFDRRFVENGVFALADELGKTVHIRSVFLQGVLLMPPEQLPACLAPLAPFAAAFHAACTAAGMPSSHAALAWALHTFPRAGILFGAETARQVRENLAFLHHPGHIPSSFVAKLNAIMPPQLPELLNPSLWER